MHIRTALLLTVLFAAPPISAQVTAQQFQISTLPTLIEYDVTTGDGSGEVEIHHQEILGPGQPPSTVQGWAIAIVTDPDFVTPVSIEMGDYIENLNGGAGPSFWTPTVCPNGFSITCVYNILGGAVCTYEIDRVIAIVTYETNPTTLAGNSVGASVVPISSSPSCVVVPITNAIVVNGNSIAPSFVLEPIDVQPLSPTDTFIRGDSNNDATLTPIADAIRLLDSLFLPNSGLDCLDAGDVNDDGNLNIADPISLLDFGFGGGPPPPAPFPACGEDPTPDSLDCSSPAC